MPNLVGYFGMTTLSSTAGPRSQTNRERHTSMASSTRSRTWIRRTAPLAAALMALAVLAACGSDDGGSGASSGGKVKVALITKDSINPFFVAMQEGAKKAATENGVALTVGAGAQDGDEEGQIQFIE